VAAAVPPGVVDGVDARVGPERVAVGCLGVSAGSQLDSVLNEQPAWSQPRPLAH